MKLPTIGKSAAMVGVAVCMTAALSSTNTASAHVIACGGIANKPVKNGSMIYATAQAGCTDYPDTYEARFVLWAWTGSRYVCENLRGRARSERRLRHGDSVSTWVHLSLRAGDLGVPGNGSHRISNSATTTKLC